MMNVNWKIWLRTGNRLRTAPEAMRRLAPNLFSSCLTAFGRELRGDLSVSPYLHFSLCFLAAFLTSRSPYRTQLFVLPSWYEKRLVLDRKQVKHFVVLVFVFLWRVAWRCSSVKQTLFAQDTPLLNGFQNSFQIFEGLQESRRLQEPGKLEDIRRPPNVFIFHLPCRPDCNIITINNGRLICFGSKLPVNIETLPGPPSFRFFCFMWVVFNSIE